MAFVQYPAGCREEMPDATSFHPPRHDFASEDIEVSEVMSRMQTQVYQRRLRVKESFQDYDPLRSGRVTPSQFVRVVNKIVPNLPVQDGELLADHFAERGPTIRQPQVVNYKKFSNTIDQVFTSEEKPTGRPAPTRPPRPSSANVTRLRLSHAAPRSSRWTYSYQPRNDAGGYPDSSQRAAVPVAPPRRMSVTCGQAESATATVDEPSDPQPAAPTALQPEAMQDLPGFAAESAAAQPDAMQPAPASARAMSPAPSITIPRPMSARSAAPIGPQPVPPMPFNARASRPGSALSARPGSALSARPGSACAARGAEAPAQQDEVAAADQRAQDEEVVLKIQAMVKERKLRVHGIFTEFDPLRRGVCSVSHVRTVCTYWNLSLEEREFDALRRLYCVNCWDKDEFNYREFSNDVNELPLYANAGSALTTTAQDGSSQKPRESIQPPTSRPTSARAQSSRPTSARFGMNKPPSPEVLQAVLGKIGKRLRERRHDLRSFFRDAFSEFDKGRRGLMSQTQFQRVMIIQDFPLIEADLRALCAAFAGSSNSEQFRCAEFLAELEKVMAEKEEQDEAYRRTWNMPLAPHTARYVDSRGRVIHASRNPLVTYNGDRPPTRAASASAACRRLNL